MKIKKILAMALACVMASSTVAYADASDGAQEVIDESVTSDIAREVIDESAPEIDNVQAEEAAEMPAAVPTFDDFDESETDESAAVATDEPVTVELYDESSSTEELVGAASYRSIYEPCFSEVMDMNQQKVDDVGGFHYEYYIYTLLDLDYDGIKELIVNASWNKHGHTYYIYTIKSGSQASLIGKIDNDSVDPIMTNGSRIAFFETYKGECWFYSSPFKGTYDFENRKLLYEGANSYSSSTAALKDLTRKKFAANAAMSPEFISIYDRSQLTAAGNVLRFSDVIPNQTIHAKEIYWAAAKGITKGYTGTNLFGVADTCTRGEAAMFLWRLAGKPAPKSAGKTPFSDVPNTHVFYNAILWAYQKGIAKGYSNGTFDINGKCTRGQIATFIWRYKGSPKPKSSKSKFKDTLTPSYKNAIIWAAENGITKGYPDNTFRDKQYCTRGEIVTFLYRVK